MLIALSVHLLFAFLPHFLPDESFYVTIPYRLVNGDRLVQDEWHLSQFSSFFTYLPVSLWIKLNGSADGLIIFLRLVYLAIHTAAATIVYQLFRTHKNWAVAAALIYYLQTPYKIYAISYNSMFAFFLLLFCACLYLIHRNNSKKLCYFAGVCFAACCIGNPVFLVTLLLYPVLWFITKVHTHTEGPEHTGPQSEQENCRVPAKTGQAESYRCFFCRQTMGWFALGIVSVAVTGLLFFFGTGGTISSIFSNLGAILDSSEYNLMSGGAFSKIERISLVINYLTLRRPHYILLLFVVMLIDTERKRNSHRLLYLLAVIPLSVLCIFGMRFSPKIDHTLLQSFPCALLSIVCYILTENRNKPLFACMWCPCAAAALINLFTSNTLLSSVGFVLAVSNVAGVIFAHDLFQELRSANQTEKKTAPEHTKRPLVQRASRFAICTVLILQMLFYLYIIQFGQPIPHSPAIVSDGPYAGMMMNREQKEYYNASLRDLDLLQNRSSEDDPVLIVSYQSWMYLHLQRPIATYTAWYDAHLDENALNTYYKLSPEKIPKYIYVVYSDNMDPIGLHIDNVQRCINTIDQMFDYTTEALNNGLLLTVTDYHGN